MTVEDLLSLLGRARIKREAGYGAQVMSRASVENIMPARWYPNIRAMCEADGIQCPEHLFRWDLPVPPPKDRAESAA